MKKLFTIIVFLLSGILSGYPLYISQEDIDGTGPVTLLDVYWGLFIYGIVALFVIGIVLYMIYALLWQLMEKVFGFKRGTFYAKERIGVGRSKNKLRRYHKLNQLKRINKITSAQLIELDELLKKNEVFEIEKDTKVQVLLTNIWGISQISISTCETLYIKYKLLKENPTPDCYIPESCFDEEIYYEMLEDL